MNDEFEDGYDPSKGAGSRGIGSREGAINLLFYAAGSQYFTGA